jgi:hypothetical protein
MMDKQTIDAARKLAADGDGLGRILDREPVVVNLFEIRVTIANILVEQAATIRQLAGALEQAQVEARHLQCVLDTRAKVSDEDFKTILAAHQLARFALKEYAEPWHWDEVDGKRRLWANNEDATAIAYRALYPEAK